MLYVFVFDAKHMDEVGPHHPARNLLWSLFPIFSFNLFNKVQGFIAWNPRSIEVASFALSSILTTLRPRQSKVLEKKQVQSLTKR